MTELEPIGICNRCSSFVYPSIVDGYEAYCPECDEDLYNFEFITQEDTEDDL